MEVRKHSVAVFYIHGGIVENAFMESVVGALVYDGMHDNVILDCRGVEGLYIADNRDLAARTFMRMKDPLTGVAPEWMLFIDTDICFGTDTLYRLLASADPVERPIMSALYFGYVKDNKLGPVWYAREADGRINHLTKFTSGPQRLGVVGMGFCLIHRSVFEKFGDTYSNTGWLYFGHDFAPWVPKASVTNDFTPFGEDNCFCYRADQLGIPVYGNGDVVVQHRKKRYEDLDTFLSTFAHNEVETDENGATLRLRRSPRQADVISPSHRVDQPSDAGSESGREAGYNLGSGEASPPLPNGELR